MGVHDEPRAIREDRNHFLITVRREVPAVFDALADVLDAPAREPALQAWAERFELAMPWMLERAAGLLDTWKRDPRDRAERRLAYLSRGPQRPLFLHVRVHAAGHVETRKQAEDRMVAEATRVIRAHLDQRYGPAVQAREVDRHATWAVRNRLRGIGPQALAEEAGLQGPDARSTVQKAIDRYCERRIDWPWP